MMLHSTTYPTNRHRPRCNKMNRNDSQHYSYELLACAKPTTDFLCFIQYYYYCADQKSSDATIQKNSIIYTRTIQAVEPLGSQFSPYSWPENARPPSLRNLLLYYYRRLVQSSQRTTSIHSSRESTIEEIEGDLSARQSSMVNCMLTSTLVKILPTFCLEHYPYPWPDTNKTFLHSFPPTFNINSSTH